MNHRMRPAKLLAAAGGLALVFGAVLDPQRAWGNLLLASFGLVCLGLAGVFFIALQYACGAGWGVSFRRVPEAMTAILPFGAVGLAAVFLFRPSLYTWTAGLAGHGAHGFKALWLTYPFFLTRAAVYLALWTGFAWWLVRSSRRQDRTGDIAHTRRNTRLSMIFLVLFAVTFSLACFDWVMSLEPHWASTIFAIYNFAGLFSSGIACLILLVLWMRRDGPLRDFVNQEHLHDLGKLLFAFSTFWMYIWFSQYMLIWYANISEETLYYTRRQHQFWQPLFFLNMLLNWGVPFLILLPKWTKRNPAILANVAIIVLIGRWLDLYQMIMPPVTDSQPGFGVQEAGALAGAAGLFTLVFMRRFASAAPVPVRDPHLTESLHYHN